jgi:hypothetical protein
VTDKEASQAKALWSKLVFTGKATMPKEAANSAAVKKPPCRATRRRSATSKRAPSTPRQGCLQRAVNQ